MTKTKWISTEAEFGKFLDQKKFSRLYLLADENSFKYCYKLIPPAVFNRSPDCMVMEEGEEHKSLDTVEKFIDEYLIHSDKHAVLICLGGGVVTDTGGFISSVFKRGISTIFIPTTLLGMVDAAWGGKNGLNYSGMKNMIGTIREPEAVFLKKEFLKTLPKIQMRSGFAEMLKHALIADEMQWNNLIRTGPDKILFTQIVRSVEIKRKIASADLNEKGKRKVLNFGHTVGHAIEALAFSKNKIVTHGHAVAVGMMAETLISAEKEFITASECDKIMKGLAKYFSSFRFSKSDQSSLLEVMLFDKKNKDGKILGVCLTGIGEAVYNIEFEIPTLKKVLAKISER